MDELTAQRIVRFCKEEGIVPAKATVSADELVEYARQARAQGVDSVPTLTVLHMAGESEAS
jgi:hypothetical protein